MEQRFYVDDSRVTCETCLSGTAIFFAKISYRSHSESRMTLVSWSKISITMDAFTMSWKPISIEVDDHREHVNSINLILSVVVYEFCVTN
jgi:hypothetical protein